MVREIGLDLLSADKLANDINYRRLLNIAVLYCIIFLLFLSILFMLYYRIKNSMFGSFLGSSPAIVVASPVTPATPTTTS